MSHGGGAPRDPDGRFRNPWPPVQSTAGSFIRWRWRRLVSDLPPDPSPDQLPAAEPDIVRPAAGPHELRVTWVGHATFLVQLGGLNILTDPVWSRRASPVQWAGPARFVPPGVAFDRLPPIDAVLLSHDHYDHLDSPTVAALAGRFGDTARWYTPLGYRSWLQRRGAGTVTELDWWQATQAGAAPPVEIVCLPARHWTRRGPFDNRRRLWSSWAARVPDGPAVYFGGDSGWFPGYREIGRETGPFDLTLLPIGAYEPRWFMAASHMNPEEAVDAFLALEAHTLGAMHWGTFRLTDEDPLEPPARLREAWAAAGLESHRLWVPAHGETRSGGPGGRLGAGGSGD